MFLVIYAPSNDSYEGDSHAPEFVADEFTSIVLGLVSGMFS